jgi:YD repeat-containing protein
MASDAIKYDRFGNVIEYRDRNGLIKKIAWDELNRNTNLKIDTSALAGDVELESATAYSAEYDALGRFKTVENDFVINKFTYNSLNHLMEETTSFTVITGINPANRYSIQREFGNSGALIGLTYPSGRAIRYTRDILDRVITVEQVQKGNVYPGNSATTDSLAIADIDYEELQIKRQKSQRTFHPSRSPHCYPS